jgi:hypothetical protein
VISPDSSTQNSSMYFISVSLPHPSPG